MKLGTLLQHIFVYLWPVNAAFEANEEHDFEPFHPEPNSDPGGLKNRSRLKELDSATLLLVYHVF